MKVRCIDNRDSILEIGKIYETFVDCTGYMIVDKNYYNKRRFEIVEEDKMEQVKIVRKLEDLEGLKNGRGLKLEIKKDVRHGEYEDVLVLMCGGLGSLTFETNTPLSNEDSSLLKAMGFEFEYKPLRTVDEVLEEMKRGQTKFVEGENNFIVAMYEGAYIVHFFSHQEILGAIYLTKEQATKYRDELNEIIGVDK